MVVPRILSFRPGSNSASAQAHSGLSRPGKEKKIEVFGRLSWRSNLISLASEAQLLHADLARNLYVEGLEDRIPILFEQGIGRFVGPGPLGVRGRHDSSGASSRFAAQAVERMARERAPTRTQFDLIGHRLCDPAGTPWICKSS